MTAPLPSRQDGFILIETIVAFAILALALGVSMQTISQTSATLVRAAEIQAAGLAYQTLAAREFAKLQDEGESAGQLPSGERWRITARLVRDDHTRPLMAVSASVWPSGGDGSVYTYQTFVSNPRQEAP